MTAKQRSSREPRKRASAAQRRAWDDMRKIADTWNKLTDEQRLTWEEADRKNRRGSRAKRKRRRSGRRLFVKVGFKRLALGQELLKVAPGSESYATTPMMAFRINNSGGRISLYLVPLQALPPGVMVASYAPLNGGVMKWKKFTRLGPLAPPVNGVCEITGLYVAKYGTPPVGKKVFVRIQQMNDYLGSLVQVMCAVVPPPSGGAKESQKPHFLAKT